VLLAADGIGTNEIATRTGVSKPTVIAWKETPCHIAAGPPW
jgi:hypothetical protein